jgi:hypothetical protein
MGVAAAGLRFELAQGKRAEGLAQPRERVGLWEKAGSRRWSMQGFVRWGMTMEKGRRLEWQGLGGGVGEKVRGEVGFVINRYIIL